MSNANEKISLQRNLTIWCWIYWQMFTGTQLDVKSVSSSADHVANTCTEPCVLVFDQAAPVDSEIQWNFQTAGSEWASHASYQITGNVRIARGVVSDSLWCMTRELESLSKMQFTVTDKRKRKKRSFCVRQIKVIRASIGKAPLNWCDNSMMVFKGFSTFVSKPAKRFPLTSYLRMSHTDFSFFFSNSTFAAANTIYIILLDLSAPSCRLESTEDFK